MDEDEIPTAAESSSIPFSFIIRGFVTWLLGLFGCVLIFAVAGFSLQVEYLAATMGGPLCLFALAGLEVNSVVMIMASLVVFILFQLLPQGWVWSVFWMVSGILFVFWVASIMSIT